jgi:hypothetical protein
MKILSLFVVWFIISIIAAPVSAESFWVNNISVGENSISWNYTEMFTNVDSIAYRIGIDREFGNNDSFVNSWEVLKADKELRKKFRESIDKEFDVRVNNKTGNIELIDVDATMATDIIGKTHSFDTIINRYTVSYKLKDGIYNASSLWFLGQANTSVTIAMPAGINITKVSGLENVTQKITDHEEISGIFKPIDAQRGEINLYLTWNPPLKNEPENITVAELPKNETKPMTESLSKIRIAGMILIGVMLVFLIYVFKLRKRNN